MCQFCLLQDGEKLAAMRGFPGTVYGSDGRTRDSLLPLTILLVSSAAVWPILLGFLTRTTALSPLVLRCFVDGIDLP